VRREPTRRKHGGATETKTSSGCRPRLRVEEHRTRAAVLRVTQTLAQLCRQQHEEPRRKRRERWQTAALLREKTRLARFGRQPSGGAFGGRKTERRRTFGKSQDTSGGASVSREDRTANPSARKTRQQMGRAPTLRENQYPSATPGESIRRQGRK
jgi:hypothetical protein